MSRRIEPPPAGRVAPCLGQAQQREHHHGEPQSVEDEGRRHAEPADQDARDGRTHDPRRVEGGGVQRDGVHEIVAPDQAHHEGLSYRRVERGGEPGDEPEERDLPVLGAPGQDEERQRPRLAREDRLGGDQQPPRRPAIGDHPREGREQEDRPELERSKEPQLERRVRQLEDQPGLRDGLHPGAHGRDELREEEDAEPPVVERAKPAWKRHGPRQLPPAGPTDGRARRAAARATFYNGRWEDSTMPDAFICDAVRTPIGRYGGALAPSAR